MHILVIDDNRLIREMVSAIIKAEGYTAHTAEGAEPAHQVLDNNDIDLILMDVEMPGMDGFQLTREIRTKLGSNWIPIIFLSGQTDEQHLAKGIDAGGDDYLHKPVNGVILSAKIRAMARIAQMKADLDAANQQLLKLTHIDALTGAINRRGMEEALDRGWRKNLRDKSELSILLLDIDHFKAYNDNYGHQQGDDCLKTFSQRVKTQLMRPADMLARYGGEEFLIILPDTPIEGARIIARKIGETLKAKPIPHAYSATADWVTTSIGISSTRLGAASYQAMIEQADQALYQAKENGRNRFISYQDIL